MSDWIGRTEVLICLGCAVVGAVVGATAVAAGGASVVPVTETLAGRPTPVPAA